MPQNNGLTDIQKEKVSHSIRLAWEGLDVKEQLRRTYADHKAGRPNCVMQREGRSVVVSRGGEVLVMIDTEYLWNDDIPVAAYESEFLATPNDVAGLDEVKYESVNLKRGDTVWIQGRKCTVMDVSDDGDITAESMAGQRLVAGVDEISHQPPPTPA